MSTESKPTREPKWPVRLMHAEDAFEDVCLGALISAEYPPQRIAQAIPRADGSADTAYWDLMWMDEDEIPVYERTARNGAETH